MVRRSTTLMTRQFGEKTIVPKSLVRLPRPSSNQHLPNRDHEISCLVIPSGNLPGTLGLLGRAGARPCPETSRGKSPRFDASSSMTSRRPIEPAARSSCSPGRKLTAELRCERRPPIPGSLFHNYRNRSVAAVRDGNVNSCVRAKSAVKVALNLEERAPPVSPRNCGFVRWTASRLLALDFLPRANRAIRRLQIEYYFYFYSLVNTESPILHSPQKLEPTDRDKDIDKTFVLEFLVKDLSPEP